MDEAKEREDICARCQNDEPGYVSVIGTHDHLCHLHWHCKPGGEHLDFVPKRKEADT